MKLVSDNGGCPHCGSTENEKTVSNRFDLERVDLPVMKCLECGKEFYLDFF